MKKFFITLIAIMSWQLSSAQMEFFHNGGAGLFVAWEGSDGIDGVGFHYYPRLNFVTQKYQSLSVGSPLIMAFSFNSQSGSSYALDLPLAIEYNLGYGATEKAHRKNAGFFIGSGVGYTSAAADGFGGSFTNWNLYSGLRMEIREYPVEIRVNFGKGLGDYSGVNKFGLSAAYIITYN